MVCKLLALVLLMISFSFLWTGLKLALLSEWEWRNLDLLFREGWL
jgi:hypothetical protein